MELKEEFKNVGNSGVSSKQPSIQSERWWGQGEVKHEGLKTAEEHWS